LTNASKKKYQTKLKKIHQNNPSRPITINLSLNSILILKKAIAITTIRIQERKKHLNRLLLGNFNKFNYVLSVLLTK